MSSSQEIAVSSGAERLMATPAPARAGWRRWLARGLPVAVMAPLLAIPVIYVVGFTLWTTWISFTDSTLLPDYTLAGMRNYTRLFSNRPFQVAYSNLVIYGVGFVAAATAIGFLLAVLLDQRIRAENVIRAIVLYPMAVSFVVTGTVWAWILNPTLGLQNLVRGFGWADFRFDWIVNRDMAIYTVVLAAVWQASGFAMSLFLAGLRSLDSEIYKAAQIDGAGPVRLYTRVVLPAIWPIIVTVLVVLLQFAVKTYDLVVALTAGGPGIATMLPSLVVYNYMFQRGQLGLGSAAAVMLLLSVAVVLLPVALVRAWNKVRERHV